ncbi:hypothetical protein [Candidatus Chloroploca sp. Khr17]|uniref:hypothetical protein n=1 Tax=Candidatus Chloroploca sp. Khr17 TaxID=2496869 RepID=UPI00101CE7E1|nr:hypothetical protein [Candidatus Chloroploca sp. Khr17]
MDASRNYALAGTALFNPMASVYWLDVLRGRKPGVGLALVSAAGAACAALASPREQPLRAVGTGLLAAAGAAVTGLVLQRFVTWVEQRDGPPAAPDARDLLVPAAAVCGAVVGAVALGGRAPISYAPYNGKPGHYRWISEGPYTAARITAWSGYLLHQLAVWGCIYAAQRARPSYDDGMRPLNWTALAVNAAGVGLHYAQTRRYYDGLAVDVPEGTSLGSAAFMLMLILAMETPRRGLIMGLKRPGLPHDLVRFVRRYHGYIFSWATVYTFWYHPMEPLPAHLGGLYHMMLLFVQSSLIYTNAHRDPRWTLALEMLVLPHSVITTLQKGSGFEGMFTFGFLGMFVLAQMHGLGLSKETRIGIGSAYGVSALAWYGLRREMHRLPDIVRVPILEYGIVGILAGLSLLMRAMRRGTQRISAPGSAV